METTDYPNFVTEIPGPRARKILAQDEQYISPSYTRSYPLVIEKGEGVVVTDVDGNRFLDFTSGIAVCSTGHSHPAVVEAIRRQAGKFLHMSGTDFYYEAQSTLAEKICRIAGFTEELRVFYGNSGAEAVEAALKLVRYHSRRPLVLSFMGAFHGRTMGALSLSASKMVHEKGFAPLVPGVTHVPYGYCYRCPYNLTYPECDIHCVKWIKDDLFKRVIPPEEVAAIFVEPIQGEGGYVVPPPEFHQRLYGLCQEYGILYVADEIQSGMGRTGKMFAFQNFGVEPDVFTLAKGIASGMPLGVMVAKKEIMNWGPGSHASTFGGNPVSCEAAIATIDLIENGLMQNAARMGAHIMEQLQEMQKRHRLIGDIRGMGLMVGIELVTDREKKTKAIEERNRAVQLAFDRGLLLLGCGENALRLIPALVVSRPEIDKGLSILDEVLTELEK
jgi:4-aminobutyrate aminotransferase